MYALVWPKAKDTYLSIYLVVGIFQIVFNKNENYVPTEIPTLTG